MVGEEGKVLNILDSRVCSKCQVYRRFGGDLKVQALKRGGVR